ncbi:hypothetical protein BGX27_010930 [Mortierella sp. AM989]|nr:hypothetical protein BGX27_010930 [Mortierella sp. AM989]
MEVKELEQESSWKLTELLKLQPNLERLDLTINDTWDPIFIPWLFQACPACNTLRINHYGFQSDIEPEIEADAIYQSALSSLEELQGTRLRDLSIRLRTVAQWRGILPRLLRSSPLLERLELQDLVDPDTVLRISEGFKAGTHSKLRHLSIVGSAHSNESDKIADLIHAIGEGGFIKDGPQSTMGKLEYYEVNRVYEFTPQSSRTLVDFHADTITVLKLNPTKLVPYSLFVNTISSLPNLRSLEARVRMGIEFGITSIGDTESAFQLSWPCLELRSISLVTDYRRDRRPSQENSLPRRCVNHLFKQIGRLKNLREWKMKNIYRMPIDMENLDELSGLKQLREIELDGMTGFPLDKRGAEWMVLYWPRLSQITLNGALIAVKAESTDGPSEVFKNKTQPLRPEIHNYGRLFFRLLKIIISTPR